MDKLHATIFQEKTTILFLKKTAYIVINNKKGPQSSFFDIQSELSKCQHELEISEDGMGRNPSLTALSGLREDKATTILDSLN